MAKKLECKDAGFECSYVARGETEEDVLRDAARHAKHAHGVEPDERLLTEVRMLVRDA